jgi:hypothetical protein
MTHDRREDSFRVFPRQRESVRMADAGGFYVEQDLATFRSLYFDFLDD